MLKICHRIPHLTTKETRSLYSRMEMNVFDQGKQISILVAKDSLVISLEKGAPRSRPSYEIHRVALLQP